jgi:4-hydroxy 2-oxovalerate aldolase|tara:strand:+ start:248 stop:1282 length:1035 start_codon:yes stop_codon:yes gene_type:complete
MKNKKVIISDVTLRDGNHAVAHTIDKKIIRKYCEFIEKTKIKIVEVGHGNGLGASSLSIGKSIISDKEALTTARKYLKNAKLSVHSIPGFSRIDDIKKGIDYGVDIFRIGTNSSEMDTTYEQIEFCKKNKVEAWGVLMMAHLVFDKKENYIKIIKFLKNMGVKTIIIMDSSGIFLPNDIARIFKNLKKFNINFGFHGHNNFSSAVWNSVTAYLNGAKIIDASIKGFGAGSGNAQLDILVTVLEKLNIKTNLNLGEIYKLAKIFPKFFNNKKIKYKNAFTEPKNIMSANYGLFSGFASKVDYFSEKYNLDDIEAFKAIGKKKPVAGQEDLIFNILFNLKNSKKLK